MKPRLWPAGPALRPVPVAARAQQHPAGAFPVRLPGQSVMLGPVMNRGKGSILSSGLPAIAQARRAGFSVWRDLRQGSSIRF